MFCDCVFGWRNGKNCKYIVDNETMLPRIVKIHVLLSWNLHRQIVYVFVPCSSALECLTNIVDNFCSLSFIFVFITRLNGCFLERATGDIPRTLFCLRLVPVHLTFPRANTGRRVAREARTRIKTNGKAATFKNNPMIGQTCGVSLS